MATAIARAIVKADRERMSVLMDTSSSAIFPPFRRVGAVAAAATAWRERADVELLDPRDREILPRLVDAAMA